MRPAFPASEYRERLDRARQALERAGFDGCVCVAPEHLYYLGGYDANTYFVDQGLVFTIGSDNPTLVIRDVDVPLAQQTSWLSDVRTYHFGVQDAAELIAAVAKEKQLLGLRIGLDLQAYALPGAYALRLMHALGPSTVADSTDVVGKLRVIQSPRELAYTREAARHAQAGLEAAMRNVKPGVTEIQLAAEIEYAMRSNGSDYPAMPTWVASGPRTPAGHGPPTDRVLQRGDLIHVEFAGVARRYHCVAIKMLSLGQPSDRVKEVCEAARDSFLAGIGVIRMGAPVSAVEEASLQPLARRSLERYAKMRFGGGISAGYPPCWLAPFHLMRESHDVFQDGMVFYAHSCLEIPEEELGVLVGGSYVLTSKGLEQLDGGTPDLFIA